MSTRYLVALFYSFAARVYIGSVVTFVGCEGEEELGSVGRRRLGYESLWNAEPQHWKRQCRLEQRLQQVPRQRTSQTSLHLQPVRQG